MRAILDFLLTWGELYTRQRLDDALKDYNAVHDIKLKLVEAHNEDS